MDGINFFDSTIMTAVQQNLHNSFTDFIFPIITYLGEKGIFWIAISLVFMCVKKTRKCGFCMLLAVGLGFLSGELILKNIICRPRPFVSFPEFTTLLISPPSGWSCPSGHSCSSFAAATTLFIHNKKLGVPALILAALIAFSRVFLFVHWPSDVLFGSALGVVSAIVVYLCAGKFQKNTV